jgi:hypothetical protein
MKKALVIINDSLSQNEKKSLKNIYFDTIVGPLSLKEELRGRCVQYKDIESLSDPGSITEAAVFSEELSRVTLSNNERITKNFIYKGYELWWIYYDPLYLYVSLPYTRFKRLLTYLVEYEEITLFKTAYSGLFRSYIESHNRKFKIFKRPFSKAISSFLPLGIFLQLMFVVLSIPILSIKRPKVLIFTGDKFDQGKDYDFRMKYIYEELRSRKINFVEFIRSLESWPLVLRHILKRKRAVVYPEAIKFLGELMGKFSLSGHTISPPSDIEGDSEKLFKFRAASLYISRTRGDVWTIRIINLLVKLLGIKSAFIAATTERNLHTFIGCKLNHIPVIGIMHGTSFKDYCTHDYLPTFNGQKTLSVDKYGVWSEWWKEYYAKNSSIHTPNQLIVSGPMRPLQDVNKECKTSKSSCGNVLKVLWISEQLAAPEEVLPYLEELLKSDNIRVVYRFRPYRDMFQNWILQNRPELLGLKNVSISDGSLQDAICNSDVVVGSHSTAVMESVIHNIQPILFWTNKWGDYFHLKERDKTNSFFASTPHELVEKIKKLDTVSFEAIQELRNRYFGDPTVNGSKWVVDQLEKEAEKRV